MDLGLGRGFGTGGRGFGAGRLDLGIDLGLRGGFGVGGTTGAEEGGFAALGGSGGRFGTGWWIWRWRIRVWGCEGGFEPRRVDLGLGGIWEWIWGWTADLGLKG